MWIARSAFGAMLLHGASTGPVMAQATDKTAQEHVLGATEEVAQNTIKDWLKALSLQKSAPVLDLAVDVGPAVIAASERDRDEAVKQLVGVVGKIVAGLYVGSQFAAASTPPGLALVGTALAGYAAKECSYVAASAFMDNTGNWDALHFASEIRNQSFAGQIKALNAKMAVASASEVARLEKQKNEALRQFRTWQRSISNFAMYSGLSIKKTSALRKDRGDLAARLVMTGLEQRVILARLDRQRREHAYVSGFLDSAREPGDIAQLRDRLNTLALRIFADQGEATRLSESEKAYRAALVGIDRNIKDLDDAYRAALKEFSKALAQAYGHATDPRQRPVCEPAVKIGHGTQILKPAAHSTSYAFSIAASFRSKAVDESCDDPPEPKIVDIDGSGTARIRVTGSPAVPCEWSLFNAGLSTELIYEPRLGAGFGPAQSIAAASLACGADNPSATRLETSGIFPGPGRLTLRIGAPRGAGPLSGACFRQGGSVEVDVEFSPNTVVPPGTAVLKPGDVVETDASGKALMKLPPGAAIHLFPNSKLGFTITPEGLQFLSLERGSIRVKGDGGNVTIAVKGDAYRFTPKGTDFQVETHDRSGSLTVFDGSVEVVGQGGGRKEITKGQRFTWPDGVVALADPAADAAPEIDGLAFGEVLDNHGAERAGTYPLVIEEGSLKNGWIWEDPKRDARITARAAEVQVDVPNGNEFWQGNNEAPRLLHRVTGDFELEGWVHLAPGPTHHAITEFVLFSPGDYLGFHAAQQPREGVAPHYRLLGGGWRRINGQNTVDALPDGRPDASDRLEAPDRAVRLKLTRHGNLWRTYLSHDGRTWSLTGRQEIEVPRTLWAGLVFKRMSYDGLGDARTMLRDLVLRVSPDEPLAPSEWDFDLADGDITGEDPGFRLSHAGRRRGETAILTGAPVEGDFDWVVRYRFDLSNPLGPGQRRSLRLVASRNGQDEAYVGIAEEYDGRGLRWHSDVRRRDGQFGHYKLWKTDAAFGLLRLVRCGEEIVGYAWRDGAWLEIQRARVQLTQPVFLGAQLHGAGMKTMAYVEPVSLSVGTLAGLPDRTDGPPVLAEEAWPSGVHLPADMEGRRYVARFPVGGLFVETGAAFVMSASPPDTPPDLRRRVLVRIDATGVSVPVSNADLLASANIKAGIRRRNDLLVSVDDWREGGNALHGVFSISPSDTTEQLPWSDQFHGIGDLIALPSGDLLVADFEARNIFKVAADGSSVEPLVDNRREPIGLHALALDRAGDRIYTMRSHRIYPYVGPSAVFRLEGTALKEIATLADDRAFGDIAVSPGGGFESGLYATIPKDGTLVRILADGSQHVVLAGLRNPTSLDFDVLSGDLWLVVDEREVLHLHSPKEVTPAGPAVDEIDPDSEEQPSEPDPPVTFVEHWAIVSGPDSADLHSGPGSKYRKRRTVPPRARVLVVEEGDGWLNVRLEDGAEGWIATRLLAPIPALDSSPAEPVELTFRLPQGWTRSVKKAEDGSVTTVMRSSSQTGIGLQSVIVTVGDGAKEGVEQRFDAFISGYAKKYMQDGRVRDVAYSKLGGFEGIMGDIDGTSHFGPATARLFIGTRGRRLIVVSAVADADGAADLARLPAFFMEGGSNSWVPR